MSIISHLKRVSLFEHFSEDELVEIEKVSEKMGYKKNATIFNEGEAGDCIFIILIGEVKIFSKKDNKEKIIAVFKEGENFGELALIDSEPRSASAQALVDSVLLSISRDSFMKVLSNNFSATTKVLQELSRRLRVTNQHVNDLVFNDAKANVVKAIINLAIQHGKRINDLIQISTTLDKVDLARFTGTTPEVVNFVLQDLQNKDVISYKNTHIFIKLNNLKTYQSNLL